jgi:nitrous oxidase accessory protein
MSKSVALLLVLAFLTASCIIAPLPVNAGSKTIVVPDDYPTISAAIGNATDGDTIFVKKGTYEEITLEINKTLSLVGEDANKTKINLHPPYNETWILTHPIFSYSNAITINANDVMLSNLTIGIHPPGGYIAATGDRIQITGNNITTGPTTGLSISGSYCNITENTSGGLIGLSGSYNVIARNCFSAISVSGDSNAITDNTCWNVYLSNANHNSVSGNKIGAPMTVHMGVHVSGNSSYNVFYGNSIAGYTNLVSFRGASAENNTFYHNNFIGRYYHLVYVYINNLAGARNFWDNGKEGNYWDDYNGTDANRDGICDVSYVIDGDNIDNYLLMFPFDIENGTVVLPPPEPFPTILVAATLVLVAVVSVGLIVYFKKHKR